MTRTTCPGSLLTRYTSSTTDLHPPASFHAGAWAWPLSRSPEYSQARRTYLLLASYDEGFAEPAEQAALSLGERLGATGYTAAWCGFGHLSAHLAALHARQLIERTVSDPELPRLMESVTALMWPAPDRVAEPSVEMFDSGALLTRRLYGAKRFLRPSPVLRVAELLAYAATSGTPPEPTTRYPVCSAGIVWSMIRRYGLENIDLDRRIAEFGSAVQQMFPAASASAG
ncbi:hypothetical protein [Kitasatospora sp. NPDC088134]|uniref:hypothetical protein n=1 Tax=Kitasatospora sp. NPDC088134 TaxID=3364071 RepID=UPI00382A8478